MAGNWRLGKPVLAMAQGELKRIRDEMPEGALVAAGILGGPSFAGNLVRYKLARRSPAQAYSLKSTACARVCS